MVSNKLLCVIFIFLIFHHHCEQIKTPEKELSNEIDNLSDAELKTLIIRMLTELIELSRKMKGEMKATQSEIKENIQGTNSEGRKLGLK